MFGKGMERFVTRIDATGHGLLIQRRFDEERGYSYAPYNKIYSQVDI